MKCLQLAVLGITILCLFKTADGVTVDKDMIDAMKSGAWVGPVQTESGSFKYKIFVNDKADVWEEDARCKEEGGRLASVHSKEESDFIHDLVWYGYFDGSNSLPERGIYIQLGHVMTMKKVEWLDGTPIDWTGFRRNAEHPLQDFDNDLIMKQRCGTIRLGGRNEGPQNFWVMAYCDGLETAEPRVFYVCKSE